MSSERRARLTPAEQKVVALVCEGLTNPQIAQRLYVSPRTIQGHLLKVFKKLDVSSRSELVAKTVRAELQNERPGTNRADAG